MVGLGPWTLGKGYNLDLAPTGRIALHALTGVYVYSGHPLLPPGYTGNSSGTGRWGGTEQASGRCSEELVDFWVQSGLRGLLPVSGLPSLKRT